MKTYSMNLIIFILYHKYKFFYLANLIFFKLSVVLILFFFFLNRGILLGVLLHSWRQNFVRKDAPCWLHG